jgi:putative ABC transport system permease protein
VASSRTRLRASARFLFRSLGLRGSAFLVALLAVTVGATVIATMLNLKADLRAKMTRELRRYGPNLLVLPVPGAAPGAMVPTLDERSVRELPALVGATNVSALLIASGTLAGGREGGDAEAEGIPATVVGADFDALRSLHPSWRVEGSWPEPGRGACVVGARLARLAGLMPGGSLRVRVGSNEARLEAAGVVSTGEAEEEQLFVPLPLLQELTGLAGRVSLAALSIDGGPEAVERAARSIETAMPSSSVRPVRPIAAAQGALLGKLERMMVLLTLVVLLLSGLCLVTTLMSIVVEREAEIGLMRSMGAGDGEILRMFLGEVGLLGILGSACGLGLGALGARLAGARLFGAPIEPRAGVVPLVVALTLALCLVALLIPLKRALSVQPAAALRGE